MLEKKCPVFRADLLAATSILANNEITDSFFHKNREEKIVDDDAYGK